MRPSRRPPGCRRGRWPWPAARSVRWSPAARSWAPRWGRWSGPVSGRRRWEQRSAGGWCRAAPGCSRTGRTERRGPARPGRPGVGHHNLLGGWGSPRARTRRHPVHSDRERGFEPPDRDRTPHRFLTQRGKPALYPGCNLCSAGDSHAAWDTDRGGVPGGGGRRCPSRSSRPCCRVAKDGTRESAGTWRVSPAGERDGTPLAGSPWSTGRPGRGRGGRGGEPGRPPLRPHADHVASPSRLNLLRAFQH